MARILFFGKFSDVAAPVDAPLPKDVADLDGLIAWICASNPEIATLLAAPGSFVAVNGARVETGCTLTDCDEIAFMSPVSGG
ncbi:MAG: MoaD/ThiS family protein [Pseudomonadota bacterium]